MGTTAQKLEYLNTTKTKIKESINLTNANITNEPFRQYAVILKNRLPEIVGDPSIIWNNYEHVTGSGTSITISTYKSIFEYSLNGDTTQSSTPTPDAPVPVQFVGGTQTININNTNYIINLTSKNLFDINGDLYSGVVDKINNGFKLTNNTLYRTVSYTLPNSIPAGTYTLSYDILYNSTTSNVAVQVRSNSTSLFTGTISTSGSTQITISDTATRIYIYVQSADIYNATIILDNVQLESGTTKTSFEPYYKSIELYKIGTYIDKIYKNNNKWYIHKEIGKVVLNGNENWSNPSNTSFSATILRFRCNDFTDIYYSGNDPLIMSNYFEGVPLGTRTKNGIARQLDSSGLNVFIDNSIVSDLTTFKTWLGTNTPIVYYPLVTSIDFEITNNYLINKLESLKLITGTNNINITSNNLPAIMNITAIKN